MTIKVKEQHWVSLFMDKIMAVHFDFLLLNIFLKMYLLKIKGKSINYNQLHLEYSRILLPRVRSIVSLS